MAPLIPDRWIPYKACGKVIEGTRIICFKVPLHKNVQLGKGDIKKIWDIKALLEKIPKLGAVIDLTNTHRYYDPRELQSRGILHKKILMPGRMIPPENKVIEFMDTVDEFLGKDCEFLIGVHCTHGLNRTGYMVCRYMRDRLGVAANDAIKKFEKARGYQIERENYVADLLGEPLPPPDVGNDTKLKPIHRKSKHNRPDDNEDTAPFYKKRFNRGVDIDKTNWRDKSWRNEKNSWRDEGGSSSSKVWKNTGNSRDTFSTKVKKSSKDSDHDRSYDYKYDY